jgi:hypothetical protein
MVMKEITNREELTFVIARLRSGLFFLTSLQWQPTESTRRRIGLILEIMEIINLKKTYREKR